jgi:hypothetical protein
MAVLMPLSLQMAVQVLLPLLRDQLSLTLAVAVALFLILTALYLVWVVLVAAAMAPLMLMALEAQELQTQVAAVQGATIQMRLAALVVRVLSFFATPAQFNISLVAQ